MQSQSTAWQPMRKPHEMRSQHVLFLTPNLFLVQGETTMKQSTLKLQREREKEGEREVTTRSSYSVASGQTFLCLKTTSLYKSNERRNELVISCCGNNQLNSCVVLISKMLLAKLHRSNSI